MYVWGGESDVTWAHGSREENQVNLGHSLAEHLPENPITSSPLARGGLCGGP